MAADYRLPLGKYKGRFLSEVIYLDPDYCQWLIQQSDLLAKHPAIAKGFSELGVTGDQTPLHNSLQALFLDSGVCIRLINRLWGEKLSSKLAKDLLRAERRERVENVIGSNSSYGSSRKRPELLAELSRYRKSIRELEEASELDDEALVAAARHSRSYTGLGRIVECEPKEIRNGLPRYVAREKLALQRAQENLVKMRRDLVQARTSVDEIQEAAIQLSCKQGLRRMEEFNGSDVHFRYTIEATLPGRNPNFASARRTFDVWIEIKPYMSDDYPSVLRQIELQRKLAKDQTVKENRFVVVVGRFGAHGASLDQVRQMFLESGFSLVLLEEIGCALPIMPEAARSTEALPLFSS